MRPDDIAFASFPPFEAPLKVVKTAFTIDSSGNMTI